MSADNMTGVVRLNCGADEAEVNTLGAEAIAWRVDGRALLWRADPAIWPRTSPVLFPIVGRVRGGTLSIGGRPYPIGIHGFAAASRFEVVQRSEDAVLLRLTDNAATREAFPYGFRLDVFYRLTSCGLTVTFEVNNPCDGLLPYALGLHPGFAWPFSGSRRDGHRIEFEREERAEIPVITPDGLFGRASRAVPLDGLMLPLSEALLANEALCFLDARSRSVRFIAPDGAAIRIAMQDFPHIALWSRPGAPFLSIEAWTGHGDPDGFAGDISEKPSMRWLAPAACARHAIRLTYEAGA